MMEQVSPLAEKLVKRYEKMRAQRGTWDSHWQEIADFVLPDRQFVTTITPGSKKNQRIYDSTAPFSNERMAAALVGLLVNPSVEWFGLSLYDDISEDEEARSWLDEVKRLMYQIIADPQSRFYMAINEAFQDVVGFGTGVVFIRHRADRRMFFRSIPLGEVWIDQNEDGVVDAVVRCFELSAARAVAMFGQNNLPLPIVEKATSGDADQKYKFIHFVYPREDRDAERLDGKSKPYASVVVNLDHKHLVTEGGFNSFPFAVGRWSASSGELYGRGPALRILPEIKMVNAMSRTIIEAAQKIADPPMMMPDDGFMGPLVLHPGGINYYRSGLGAKVEPLFSGARPDIGVDMLDQRRNTIREAHFLDILDLPLLDRMTATEVQQRQYNRMQLLAPFLSRLQSELIGPVLSAIFQHLVDNRMIEDRPESIRGKSVRVVYESALAVGQRSGIASSIERFLAYMTPIVNVDPSAIQVIHPERYAEAGRSLFGVPQRIFRSKAELSRHKRQMAEAAESSSGVDQAKTAAEAAQAGASAISTLSEAGL